MKHLYFLLTLTLVTAWEAQAQQEVTLHLMNNVFQASHTNPALVPKNNIHITFIPSISAGVSNSGFHYNQLAAQVQTDEDGQRVLDLSELYGNIGLSGRDYFNLNASVDILGVGFKVGKNRFSLNITEHIQGRLGYGDALLKVAAQGNTPGETLDFKKHWLKALHYREIGVGFNRKLLEEDKLVVGGRIKTLFGLSNVNTQQVDLTLKTGKEQDLYALTINSDIKAQTSGLDLLGEGETDYILNTQNFGMGLDLGATYEYNEQLSFSASLINVGFIRWKSDVTNYQSEGTFTFEGSDNDGFFTGEGLSFDVEQLVDSIADTFEVIEDSSAYTTGLPTQLYLTGHYRLAPNTIGSATLYADFIGSFRRGLTLGVRQQVGRWLQATATYSMLGRSYTNLGLGLAITTGPKGLQLFAVTDNLVGALNPGSAKMINVRTGLNLVF